jgi:vacuolar-type H+-ATPase subunit F/Vma7
MNKVLVITYSDIAVGFKLAGVDVITPHKDEEISDLFEECLDNNEYGLVAVEEIFLANLNEGIRKKLARAGKPIIVPITTPRKWAKKEEADTYLARLVRKAIGYQVKIKR